MSALFAQAVGMLETTPFADWLVRAQDQHLTGTLVLEEPGGQRHGLYFEAGTPSRAKTASPVVHLGEVLVERGELSAQHCAETVERAREQGLLHGQLLLAEGFVDHERLGEALREQLTRQVVWLFGQPERTKFGYFDAANFLVDWGAPPLVQSDTRQLLWLGIREHARLVEIEQTVAQLFGLRITLRSDLPLTYFDFMAEDRAVIDLLRARPQRMGELLTQYRESAPAIKRVLHFLVLSRSVDLGFPSAPPLGLDALPAVEAIEPPPSPSFSEPHRPSFAPVVPDLIPQTLAPARAALLDRDARRSPTPTERAAHESAKQEATERVTSAELSFRRAEELLARGSFEVGEREARVALEGDPERPEYIALCAWFSAMKPEPNVTKLAAEFKRALRLPGDHVKVRWYRGLVLKRLGRHVDALREFRFVVTSDPLHFEAAREVRIYEARLRRSPKNRPSLAPEGPPRRFNLLSWLFKRRGSRMA